MPDLQDVLHVLDRALQLQGRALHFTPETPLLGALPELDSMGVVALLSELETHFGVFFDDSAISADSFATVAQVCKLVEQATASS
ncbi:acyl carrier protein [Aquabacterium lacunae]|jgi:acyl carrier protein|uniref:Acyl carrier protein n=1 Tax=Aquabacterium lacunae TaxID=2528630 RepID=A0A4Q9GXU3_9BURK|nr:acyl carrier protein [Aquabacterium lacunae]TBO30226.1 acyl carrier protein [Aquabacterium lacunae]